MSWLRYFVVNFVNFGEELAVSLACISRSFVKYVIIKRYIIIFKNNIINITNIANIANITNVTNVANVANIVNVANIALG